MKLRGIILISLMMIGLPAYATTVYAVVHLQDLAQVKPHQKCGEELYINVEDVSSKKAKKTNAASSLPLYWRLSKNNCIKNITLWQGKLTEGELVKINFTVLERDLPPYEPNDQVGSMVLTLKNVDGVLKSHWVNGPNTKNTVQANASAEDHVTTKFSMSGSGEVYEMVLKVKRS